MSTPNSADSISQQNDNPTVENPLNDNRSTEVMSLLSRSSLFSSNDEESRATVAFCQAFRRLNTENRRSDFPDCPSWDSLPWPAKKRLFFHLRTDKDCADLANLAQVSPPFHKGVHEFMKNNRPAIKNVEMYSTNSDEMTVDIDLYPSNLPFHYLATLDAGRFNRMGSSAVPRLQVTLNDPEDPIIQQVFGLLSSYVNDAYIRGGNFSPADFQLCSHLLSNANIGILTVVVEKLDDTIAAHILSLAAQTKVICFNCINVQFSDPGSSVAFITQLASHVSYARLRNYFATTSFYGLTHSFWNNFLNEKLANGSFEFVKPGNTEEKITEAPFVLPDTPIRWLQWRKKE